MNIFLILFSWVFSYKFIKSIEQMNISHFYILPLKIEHHPYKTTKNEMTTEEIILSLLKTKYTSTIFTGTPKKSIPFELSFDTYSLYISSNNVTNNQTEIYKFNPYSSSTYEQLSDEKAIKDAQKCDLCIFAKESFYIQENNTFFEFKNTNFVLGNKLNNKFNKVSAAIGLKPVITDFDIIEDNFITQLRHKNYINEYSFRLRFSVEKNKNIFNNGEFIIGAYPHQYLPNIYDEKDFKYFYIDSDSDYWEFPQRGIMYGNNTLQITYNLILDLETIFITSSYKLFSKVSEQFFDELFIEGYCQAVIYNALKFIICDENEKVNINKMKDLVIYPENSLDNINITFTPSDLFYRFIDNNGKAKLLYLICFSNDYNEWGKLGNIFIKKYQPIFDFEKKIIGFYDKIYPDEEDKYIKGKNENSENNDNNDNKKRNDINEDNKGIIILVIIIVILGVLFIALVIIFYYYIKINKLRTKRANELQDDEFIYVHNKENTVNDNNKLLDS